MITMGVLLTVNCFPFIFFNEFGVSYRCKKERPQEVGSSIGWIVFLSTSFIQTILSIILLKVAILRLDLSHFNLRKISIV